MACQRLFAPDSKLQLIEWGPDTALSYLVGLKLGKRNRVRSLLLLFYFRYA
jgi:hypothetical protein